MSVVEPLIRPAEVADIPVLVELRLAMFRSMGRDDPETLDQLAGFTEAYLRAHLPDGSYRGWVVEIDGQIAATGGLVIRQAPPTYHNFSGREGYVMSMYTRPQFRHRGLATALLNAICDALRGEGVGQVTLRASHEGRPLYEKLGFTPTPEMKLKLQ